MKTSVQNVEAKFREYISSNNTIELAKLKGHECPIKLAFLLAVKNKAFDVLEVLNGFNVDIDAKDAYGCTALGYAMQFRSIEWIKKLIELGADPDLESILTYPMVDAVRTHNPEIVKLLLNIGAKVNCKEESGLTTMEVAVREGNAEIFKMLLENGGNLNQRTLDGKTLVQFVKKSGKKELIEVLRSFTQRGQSHTLPFPTKRNPSAHS